MIEQIPIRIVSHDPVPPHNANVTFRTNRGG